MATSKKVPSALGAIANAAGAGQRVKAQTASTPITWDTAEARIGAAVKAEGAAHKTWLSASDTLWILGVRPRDFDTVVDSNGKQTDSDTTKRVRGMVVKGFSARAQSLLGVTGAALSGLSEAERGERRYWTQRIPVMMQRIVAYLKRHEENERGASTKSTLAESIVKVLKLQKGRIQKAPAEKVDFKIERVLELLDETIAELT